MQLGTSCRGVAVDGGAVLVMVCLVGAQAVTSGAILIQGKYDKKEFIKVKGILPGADADQVFKFDTQ